MVGEAADGAEAVALTERLAPAVVPHDIGMPDVYGLAAARTVLAARTT